MNFITLINIELLKLKRSQVMLMTILCPLSVVALQFLVAFENNGKAIADKGWAMYWTGTISLWYMLMLPLYIALITLLMNAIEHKNSTWRFMASMPIQQWKLYLCKGFISWVFVLIASLTMYGFTSLSIGIMMLLGYESQGAFVSPFLTHLSKVMITALPIVVFGHIISWRWKSVIAPLAIGIVMTITAMTMVNSTEYWMYNPWTFHMTATLVNNKAVVSGALFYAITLSLFTIIFSTFWLGRKEIA